MKVIDPLLRINKKMGHVLNLALAGERSFTNDPRRTRHASQKVRGKGVDMSGIPKTYAIVKEKPALRIQL